jgi:hypothetical protein
MQVQTTIKAFADDIERKTFKTESDLMVKGKKIWELNQYMLSTSADQASCLQRSQIHICESP